MREKWLKTLQGKYEISNLGNIRNFKTKRILKVSETKLGYKRIAIRLNGLKKNYRVHRLVAEAFLQNPKNKPDVDHIDRNRSNNKISNLRWVTKKENCNNRKFLSSVETISIIVDLHEKGLSIEDIYKKLKKG